MRLKNLFLLILLTHTFILNAQQRKEIRIPDIPGYVTLKCDFHIHTVFSDGSVWPTVRVEEAWLEGLDAISITDHIEYLPHSADIIADHNRSYEIALPLAESKNIILIQGTEITRDMPPGHLNALFIKNANLLDRENVNDALREAKSQGAFIIWNHPGWKNQQPDTTLWWEEHTILRQNNLLHGIEVVNETSYYPEALIWANTKNLTIFGNSDIHSPINMQYDLIRSHRPMTLVFAKERTKSSIKEALIGHRTVIYFDNKLIGKARYLELLFFESISINNLPMNLKNQDSKSVLITNNSDIDYDLELAQPSIGFECPEKIKLKAHHSSLIELTGNSDEVNNMKNLRMVYSVTNMITEPEMALNVTFEITNR